MVINFQEMSQLEAWQNQIHVGFFNNFFDMLSCLSFRVAVAQLPVQRLGSMGSSAKMGVLPVSLIFNDFTNFFFRKFQRIRYQFN
jgi:hypothetical protein